MIDSSILQNKTAAYFTLGCKLNFAETSTLGQSLKSYGVQTVQKGQSADICIINTCSVTEVADQKCRQAIRRLVRQHPHALVVVTGCYAQLQPQQILDMPGVDLVLGTDRKSDIIPVIMQKMGEKKDLQTPSPTLQTLSPSPSPVMGRGEGHPDGFLPITGEVPEGRRGSVGSGERVFFPSCSRGDRTRYFLKVQDGCNYFCTYCTIPLARGRSRNGSIQSLVQQARAVAQEGGKEIVITGVNIGDFGRTTHETFLQLIQQLDQVEGIERYRISSIEPNLLTDEIIDFCAHSRHFMPHFHIPLQSGSDAVLQLMHRRYDTALFRHRVEHIKQLLPHSFIGVDVIVGTRGETADHFEESYRFIQSLPISQLHVFSYSERPGTRALQIPHTVSPQEKHQRSQRLLALSDEKLHQFYAAHIGQTRPVLFEHAPRTRPMHGFTDNYIRVEIPHTPTLAGHIQSVTLGDFTTTGDALTGIL